MYETKKKQKYTFFSNAIFKCKKIINLNVLALFAVATKKEILYNFFN